MFLFIFLVTPLTDSTLSFSFGINIASSFFARNDVSLINVDVIFAGTSTFHIFLSSKVRRFLSLALGIHLIILEPSPNLASCKNKGEGMFREFHVLHKLSYFSNPLQRMTSLLSIHKRSKISYL